MNVLWGEREKEKLRMIFKALMGELKGMCILKFFMIYEVLCKRILVVVMVNFKKMGCEFIDNFLKMEIMIGLIEIVY